MSKAEVLAREIYPDWELTNNPKVDVVEQSEVRIQRAAFVEGYHQAEKDLELTVDDIRKIDYISTRLDCAEETKGMSIEELYQEVLKRFKDFKATKEHGTK